MAELQFCAQCGPSTGVSADRPAHQLRDVGRVPRPDLRAARHPAHPRLGSELRGGLDTAEEEDLRHEQDVEE
jgi:hypothetical protein